jgi:hypothetical protein
MLCQKRGKSRLACTYISCNGYVHLLIY